MNNQRQAQQIWEMARKNLSLENFSELATKYSVEAGSRALGGEVPPIRKFGGQPTLEDEAFSLKPDEISGVIQVEDRFVILYCEGLTKPIQVEFAKVRDLIYEDIRQKKERVAMAGCFEHLQETAAVDNFLAGTSHSPARPTADNQAGRAEPAAYYAPAQERR
jgi:serine/threonine protein phosphatase PrpC